MMTESYMYLAANGHTATGYMRCYGKPGDKMVRELKRQMCRSALPPLPSSIAVYHDVLNNRKESNFTLGRYLITVIIPHS